MCSKEISGFPLLNSFKNVLSIIIRPVDTVKKISDDPDYFGPLIIIGILLVLYTVDIFMLTTNIKYYTEAGVVTAWEAEVKPYITLLLAARVLYNVIMWFVYFIVILFVSRFLGSDKEVYSLFSASGYVLHVQVLRLLIEIPVLWVFIIQPGVELIVSGLYKGSLTISSGIAYSLWEEKLGVMRDLRGLSDWVFIFWSGVYTYAVYRIERELEQRKAVIGTIATIALLLFITTILKLFLML